MSRAWEDIKIEVLIRSARHCAVCRRFAGVGVEVHHLVPKADAGPDAIENAVALCFDCHMYAGAEYYSPQHPRGTKYSVKEVRRARDRLYQDVTAGRVSTPADLFAISLRYLFVHNYEIAMEIAEGDTAGVPLGQTVLAMPNDVSRFYSQFATATGLARGRALRIPLGVWPDRDTYLRDRSGVVLDGSLYTRARQYTGEELERARNEDLVTAILLDAGCPPDELIAISCFENPLSGDFYESIRLREVVPAFLCLRNEEARPVTLVAFEGLSCEESPPPRDIASAYGKCLGTYKLPQAALDSGSAVVVPAATVVAPLFAHDCLPTLATQRAEVTKTMYPLHVVMGLGESPIMTSGHLLIGPSLLARRLEYEVLGRPGSMPIHRLDPERTYILDASFRVGG